MKVYKVEIQIHSNQQDSAGTLWLYLHNLDLFLMFISTDYRHCFKCSVWIFVFSVCLFTHSGCYSNDVGFGTMSKHLCNNWSRSKAHWNVQKEILTKKNIFPFPHYRLVHPIASSIMYLIRSVSVFWDIFSLAFNAWWIKSDPGLHCCLSLFMWIVLSVWRRL